MTGNTATGSMNFPSALSLSRVEEVMSKAVLDGVVGGATVVASLGGELVCSQSWGSKAATGKDSTPADLGTVFDLDSITEALCTTTLLMRMVDSSRLSLSERACRYLQPLGIGQKAQITVTHLLSQTAGFGAAPSLFDELTKANAGSRLGILSSGSAKAYTYAQLIKSSLRYDPGARYVRSATNSILLGNIIENLTGLSLDRAFQKYVAAPLQLKSLGFIDVAMLRRRNLAPATECFMPSGDCSKRGKTVAGEVWDENAYVMGGVAGHSGLFGTARDVHAWGVELVKALYGESELITQQTALSFWAPVVVGAKSEPVARHGFELASLATGFGDTSKLTEAGVISNSLGSSVLIDPQRRAVVVCLSNADYSGHHNRPFVDVRGELHSAILQ